MSGVAVRILAADVISRLEGMGGRAAALLPVLQNFGQYMKGSILKNFQAGGRPDPWAPLKLGTLSGWAVSKKSFTNKKGLLTTAGQQALAGRRPLIDTSLLMNSTFYTVVNGGVQVSSQRSGKSGVNIAAVQQFGAAIPPIFAKPGSALFWPGAAHPVKSTKGGVIPPRPFMLFQDEDIDYFERTLIDFVMTGRIS